MRVFDTKIIAVTNQKGGVGKTTTAVNVAAYLAAAEIPTLLVDMDPQSNATTNVGLHGEELNGTIYDALISKGNATEIIQHTDLDFLDIFPSDKNLVGAEIELVSAYSREYKLKKLLMEISGIYKFVIIDSPPSLGLLTVNVLTAADSVLVPIQCEYFALEGLSQLLNTIQLVQGHLNKKLEIEGILITMYDNRLNLSRQVVQEVQDYFGDKVYRTFIKRNVRLGESPSHGKPILLYNASSMGAQNYMNLVSEILAANE